MSKALQVVLGLIVLALAPLASGADVDPPARVGRVSLLSGEVDLRPRHRDEPEEARLNHPVTSGNVLATGRGSRAEVRIGSTAIRADGDTELAFERLDDERIRLELVEGSLAVRVRNPEDAAQTEIVTPRGRLQLLEPGRYRVDSEGTGERTRISVFGGRARFQGSGASLLVRPGERLEVEGWDPQRISEAEARRDEFDDWALARDRRDEASRASRYLSEETTGYEELDHYGEWDEHEAYGPIWIPHGLAADWAPYRYGVWAWVDPWGWTWVDDTPWGFAPFHYGRWVLVGHRWAWVPGRIVRRPVYAPALVVWLGAPGVSIGVGAFPELGWFPLAPREVYVPIHRHSATYLRRANIGHVHGQHIAGRPARYAYRHEARAVTVVPARVVAERRPIRREVVAVRERRELAALPLAAAGPALAPLPPAARPASPDEAEARARRRERWEGRREERDRLRAAVEARARIAAPQRPVQERSPPRAGERLPAVPSPTAPAGRDAAAPAPARPPSADRARQGHERAGPARTAPERQAAETERHAAERRRAQIEPQRQQGERQRRTEEAARRPPVREQVGSEDGAAESQRRMTRDREAAERQRHVKRQGQEVEQQHRQAERQRRAEEAVRRAPLRGPAPAPASASDARRLDAPDPRPERAPRQERRAAPADAPPHAGKGSAQPGAAEPEPPSRRARGRDADRHGPPGAARGG